LMRWQADAGLKAMDLLLMLLFILDPRGIRNNLRQIREALNNMEL